MNRREALKYLALLSGGVMLSPSCTFSSRRVSVALDHLQISPDLETRLAEIVQAIIPKTDTPGARDLNIHRFVLVMVDDCCGKEQQDAFVQGLKAFDPYVKKEFNASFAELNTNHQKTALSRLLHKPRLIAGSGNHSPKSLRTMAKLTRRYTIKGYRESEYVLTELHNYQLVPGHYSGCVNLKQDS